ncbi:hypothetical protein OIO90_001918 [Microbotryomycetes sp. JL221]|nr:hypothetical protein OIO90_001918 [Microbotryomycetes sp. JL221]
MSFRFVNNNPPFPSRSKQPQSATTTRADTAGTSLSSTAPPIDTHSTMGGFTRALPEYGSPNELPNPPSHYFPSKPGAKQRVLRFQQQQLQQQQHHQQQQLTQPLSHPPDTSRTPTTHDRTQAERDAIAALVEASSAASTRTSTSQKRLSDRSTWDAGTELMREEQERQTASANEWRSNAPSSTTVGQGKRKVSPADEEQDELENDRASTHVDEDGDDASMTDAPSMRSEAMNDQSDGGPKKRSRTLTTAHQTAVLNALLAKTRFPSTETREEVGKQIGMSARRVQIWFQNRRQSQKRQRDREASEIGAFHSTHVGPSAHQLHYEYQHQQQRMQPYARGYPPAPPTMSSSSSTSTARPDLVRQTSHDSVASHTSARSSMGSFHVSQAHRDVVPPLSDVPPRWPSNSHPMYGNGWQQGQNRSVQSPLQSPQQQAGDGPRQVSYFPRYPQTRPSTKDSESRAQEETKDAAVKLPSLSSVLGGTLPDSPAMEYGSGQATPRQATFSSHFGSRPPPPAPSSGTRAIPNPQIMPPMSPAPSDSFSRLRLSSEGPGSPPTRHASPPDMLDAVMETMYRPTNVVPARASLPPLRNSTTNRGSEADAALLAPIRPTNHQNSNSTNNRQQLPPISSITGSLQLPSLSLSSSSTGFAHPTHPFPPREKALPQLSSSFGSTSSSGGGGGGGPGGPGRTDTAGRSSVSSFDTSGTSSAWTPASIGSSSRTSFSSEVQDEWDRVSRENNLQQSGVRKVKTIEVSPWDDRRGMVGSTNTRPSNVTPQPNFHLN